MTSFSDTDTEILVEMIRQQPALYDPTLNSYRDEGLKDETWKSIALYFNKSEEECRKKWKLLRDSYNRIKRTHKSKKYPKWQLFTRLNFLDVVPPRKQINTTIEMKEEDYSTEDIDVDYEEVDNIDLNEVKPSPEISTSLDATSAQETLINSNFQQQTPKIISTTSEESLDDIASFTKNIEVCLRRLSARSKALAKGEIFNVITKYEMIDIEGENASSYCMETSKNHIFHEI